MKPDYADKYGDFAILDRSDDGVLTVRFSTDGGPLYWGGSPHRYMPLLFEDIGNDFRNELVILTGTGNSFISGLDFGDHQELSPRFAAKMFRESRRSLQALLDIDAPLIAAINGPCRVHAELAVLCDIVIATPDTILQDAPHYPAGLVPGDGVHVVWPALLGPNRGRYFLLMGEEIEAQELLRLGVIAEVVSPDELMDRAHAIAAQLMKAPPRVRRYTGTAIRARLRKVLAEDLELGIAIETVAAMESWPTGEHGVTPSPDLVQ